MSRVLRHVGDVQALSAIHHLSGNAVTHGDSGFLAVRQPVQGDVCGHFDHQFVRSRVYQDNRRGYAVQQFRDLAHDGFEHGPAVQAGVNRRSGCHQAIQAMNPSLKSFR